MGRAQNAREFAGLVASRVRELPHRARFALVSGVGSENFGDDWMLQGLREALPRWTVIPLAQPEMEARLRRLGLSGPRFFSGGGMGGGTLINGYFHSRAAPILDTDLPLWCFGTGVGSPGYGIDEAAAHGVAWSADLLRFRELGIRGERSVSKLREIGVPSEPVGDLAFIHAPEVPLELPAQRRALVNVAGRVTRTEDAGAASRINHGIRQGIARLRAEGWVVEPLVMHHTDARELETLGRDIGGWDGPGLRPGPTSWDPGRIQPFRAVISTRLHGAVLGWVYGRQVTSIGYREKCADAASLVGATADVVDVGQGPAAISDAIRKMPQRCDAAHLRKVEEGVGQARDRLRELCARVDAEAPCRSWRLRAS